jgi:hypothetical protein
VKDDASVVDVAEAVEKGGVKAGLPDDEVAGEGFFREDCVGGGGRISEVVLW